MSAPALTTCPKDVCGMKRWGKGKVTRAIGAGAGLIFKGSGFYITDYRSENYKAGAKKDAPASSSSSSDSKPATESKAAATPTPAATPAPAAAPAKSASKSAAKSKAK